MSLPRVRYAKFRAMGPFTVLGTLAYALSIGMYLLARTAIVTLEYCVEYWSLRVLPETDSFC